MSKMMILVFAFFGLLFIAAGVLWFIGSRAAEEEDDEEGAPGASKAPLDDPNRTQPIAIETADSRARKKRMLALKASFESSLQTRGGPRASTTNRLKLPWFMLVGAASSHDTPVLAHTGLPLPYGPALEVDPSKRGAGRWWLFEDAVVLEAPPAATAPRKDSSPLDTTLPDPASADTLASWNNFIGLLRRERPDSPLNGIIVTVSCADLLGSGRGAPGDVGDQAERIRAFLDRTQKTLGIRLPVHVLVTRCDLVPGFTSFAKCLPQARRDDMFGWVNPNPLEAPFQLAWVVDGFKMLTGEVANLHDELLAALEHLDPQDADGVFLFANGFADIQEPLRDFFARLMPQDERRPSFFFRGMYFTGDTLAQPPASDSQPDISGDDTLKVFPVPTDDAPTVQQETSAADTKEHPHNLVFLKALFANKIFREAGLARPIARFTVSRDRRTLALQAATIVLTLVGSVGLWTSMRGLRTKSRVYATGLRSDAAQLTQVLGGVGIDLDEVAHAPGPDTGADRRVRDAAAIELVGELRDAAPIRLRSVFLPTSWFSPLPGEIRQSVLTGLQKVVLPLSRQRLLERLNALRGTTPGAGAASEPLTTLDPDDPHSLVGYLNDVHALSRNIDRYNALASPGSGTAGDLAALLDYLFGERPLAGDSTRASPEFSAAIRAAAAPKIDVKASGANAIVPRALSFVRAVADSSARQLSTSPLSAKPEDDVLALRRLDDLSDLLDAKTGLVGTVSDSTMLGVKLARMVQDSIARALAVAAVRIARDTMPADRSGQRLRTTLGHLFHQPFMEKPEGRDVTGDLRPGEVLRWDTGSLELALALRGEFKQASIILGDAVAAPVRARLQKSLEVQLRARVVDVAASAQRFVPDSGAAADPSAELQAAGENLDAASPRLVRISKLLDTLGASAQARQLLAAGARQAERQLALAQLDFDRHAYFAPHTASVAAWVGGFPIGFAALGATDTAGFGAALLGLVPPVLTLAHGVAPALHYLATVGGDSARLPKLRRDWEGIAAAVQRYDSAPPSSSIFVLSQFLQQQMAASDLGACQAALAKTDAGKVTDVFLKRRREFHAAMAGRCGGAAVGEAAAAAYDQLRGTFQTGLAGRFPFAAPGSARPADADPGLVRDFLRQYDTFAAGGEIELRSDPRYAESAKAAFAFLDQIAQVRAFLGVYVDSGVHRTQPEFSLNITLAKGANTAEREVEVASRTISIDADEHEESWWFGDSFVVPGAGGSSDKKADLSTGGGWSVLRYVLQPGSKEVVVRFFHPDTKIELVLPAFPVSAPGIGLKK